MTFLLRVEHDLFKKVKSQEVFQIMFTIDVFYPGLPPREKNRVLHQKK